MARLSHYDAAEQEHLLSLPCPVFAATPFITGLKLAQARVALLSTAGLHRRGDRPFGVGETGYRLIPKTLSSNDLVMSHISTNFDRTGFQRDLNIVFPLDRLNELVREGFIGGCAAFHYSFMGATDPRLMEGEARRLAAVLKKDRVDAVLLVPV